MNIIFTDIDGVLQTGNIKKWNKHACLLFSNICKKYNLKPVITSTWRVNYNIKELQNIFYNQGIDVKIYDYTDVLGIERGEEIKIWLQNNNVDNYCVIDDNIIDILPYCKNVISVKYSYEGLTDENIKEIDKIFKNT